MEMNIKGITQQDVELCNRLWNIHSVNEVQQYLASLEPFSRQRASLMLELMALEITDTLQEIDPAVAHLLQRL
jgi:hypothetical protein